LESTSEQGRETPFRFGSPAARRTDAIDKKSQRLFPFLSEFSAEGVNFSKGGWIAYVKFPQGELWRSKADGSEPLQLTFHPLIAHDPHWSPDGKRIAYSGLKPGGTMADLHCFFGWWHFRSFASRVCAVLIQRGHQTESQYSSDNPPELTLANWSSKRSIWRRTACLLYVVPRV
jgi:hypothetical protein